MVMARNRSCWVQLKPVVLIWTISTILFYYAFQMALQNSSVGRFSPPPPNSGYPDSSKDQRMRLYAKMERDLDEHGAAFLKQGETSQSLSLSDIFTIKDGHVIPKLKAANPPVRANVLHLSIDYSISISDVVKNVFSPYFHGGKITPSTILNNSSMYHFSLFHASHHISPVLATEAEIEAEANAVKNVAKTVCPLNIVLDRVVLTSTGVLLGCWQVVSGTDPINLRAKLRSALSRAPEKQLYDAAILHTSLARLLGTPTIPYEDSDKSPNQLQFFHDLVAQLNDKIRGFEAVVSELWYVEELDVLALALDGRMKVKRFQLGCSKP
ncbi:hypothetical protein V2J09_014963 [Rumex salicifolius]